MYTLINEPVVLTQYPIIRHDPYTEATLGDLHGNTLTLIYFLLKENILTLTPQDYQELVNIYSNSIYSKNNFNCEIIASYTKVIKNLCVNNTTKLVRLIGDDLCDRGQNDYFTLLVYKKLALLNQPFEILLSNHTIAFLEAIINFHKKNVLITSHFADSIYSTSLTNLNFLIKNSFIDSQELFNLVKEYYLPHVKLVSYSVFNTNNIILYTHAPVDLNIIKNIAAKLHLSFNDDSLENLVLSIDAINQAFQNYNICVPENLNQLNSIIKDIIWNRDYKKLDWQKKHIDNNTNTNYLIYYAYGHDKQPVQSIYNNAFGLDNNLGKSINDLSSIQTYKVLLIK